MQPTYYIAASCSIGNHSIVKNGEEIFAGDAHPDAIVFLTQAYKNLEVNYPRFYKMDNLSKLGWLCTELLLRETNNEKGISIDEADKAQVSIMLCNASSSLDTDLRYQESMAAMPSPALFVYTLPNIVIGEICIRNGWKGENIFMVKDAFDAGFIHEQVSYLLSDSNNKFCLCGWVELLGRQYSAHLFFVSKLHDAQSITFTPQNLRKLTAKVPSPAATATT